MHTIAKQLLVIAGVLMLTASACTDIDDPNPVDHTAHLTETPTSACLLDYINRPAVDLKVLDLEVGLDHRAAANLIAWRDGADGVRGTADDTLYANTSEITRVERVGDRAMRDLTMAADAWCNATPGQEHHGVFEGVAFSLHQAEMTLTVVNTLSEADLAWVLRDNPQAADAIVEHREIMSIDALAALPGVERRELARIRVEAMR